MATIKTPFLGAFYEARSKNQCQEECINLFLELDEEKAGKTPGMLLQTPGLDFLVSASSGGGGFLLAEDGSIILTEDGQPIQI